jgi:hypothetical protein
MPKQDSASKRLAVIVALQRQWARPKKSDWSDPAKRAEAANRALSLASPYRALGDGDWAVKKAFEVLRLDPEDPFDWKGLIYLLAETHFVRRKKSGGRLRRQWTAAACDLFEARVADAKQRLASWLLLEGITMPKKVPSEMFLGQAGMPKKLPKKTMSIKHYDAACIANLLKSVYSDYLLASVDALTMYVLNGPPRQKT